MILAHPIQIDQIQPTIKNGIDIVVVVDISKSMLAEDILPSRLSVARSAISSFIGSRTTDRVALIGFAGKPFLMSPLTTDISSMQSIITKLGVDSIRQELSGLSGTAIGDALLLATDTLSLDMSRERVVVLLTDGEANVGIDPRSATVYAQEAGVRVYTIGLGSTTGTDLYTTDINGKKQYFLDSSGVPIRARVDEALMRYIATTTGGVYANALSSTDLEKIFQDIQSREKRPIIRDEYTSESLIFYPIVLTLLALWSLLWIERRRIGSPFIARAHHL